MKNIKLDCVLEANSSPIIYNIDTALRIFLETLRNFKIVYKIDKNITQIIKEVPNGVQITFLENL